MTTISKQELMRNLQCTRNSFYLANYAIALAHHLAPTIRDGSAGYDIGAFEGPEAGAPSFRQFLVNIDNYTAANNLRYEEELLKTSTDVVGGAVRRYQHEVFEHIWSYVKGTTQEKTFQSEPWYKFARIVRNSFAHNWKIDCKDKLKPDESTTFAGITITYADNGREMAEIGLTHQHLRILADVMIDFAETLE